LAAVTAVMVMVTLVMVTLVVSPGAPLYKRA